MARHDATQIADGRNQTFDYFQWCEVVTHDARYSVSLKSLATEIFRKTNGLFQSIVTTSLRMDDKWFKARQKEVGVTAEDIARRMGRTRSNVSHIYSGQQRMSLEWAQAFSDVLNVPLDEVLARAGVLDHESQAERPVGFAEVDAAPFVGKGAQKDRMTQIAQAMGGERAGIDQWVVQSDALSLDGYLPGDAILVDTHQSEQCRAGDIVIAQRYNWKAGTAETILRRFEPPVLVAASPSPGMQRVDVVDGSNVVIKGKVVASWRMK